MERTKENTVPIITTDEWIGKTDAVRAAAKEHNRNVERIKGLAALVERHNARLQCRGIDQTWWNKEGEA